MTRNNLPPILFAVAIILIALVLAAHAKDNNPFSGARSITVKMHRVHKPMCRRNWWVDQGQGPIERCGTETNERPIK